jgi:hypothetical protein
LGISFCLHEDVELGAEITAAVEDGDLTVAGKRSVKGPWLPAIERPVKRDCLPTEREDHIDNGEAAIARVLAHLEGLLRLDQDEISINVVAFEFEVELAVAFEKVGLIEEVSRDNA